MQLGHERLEVYRMALGVARWAAGQVLPVARRHLRDQLVRAADSMVLNIAEGAGHPPGEARCAAPGSPLPHRGGLRGRGRRRPRDPVLNLVALPGGPDRQVELRRVTAMLVSLVRR